jgi:hypothetical protein
VAAVPVSATRGEQRIKGLTFRTSDVCFKEMRGQAARDRAHQLMSPDLREAFHKGLILTGSWYPIEWYREMHRAMRAATGEGTELARRLGYVTMQYDMKRIHNRLISRLVSPQMLFKFGARVFNSYYEKGDFTVVKSGQGNVRARLDGCVGFNQSIFIECAGGSVALLEAAGAKEVRLHVLEGGRDADEHMVMEAHWI